MVLVIAEISKFVTLSMNIPESAELLAFGVAMMATAVTLRGYFNRRENNKKDGNDGDE